VTGWVQAEGSFTYSRSGGQLAIYFAMRSGHEDAPLLEELRAHFGGAGRLWTRPGRGGARGTAYYRINRLDELEAVIDQFERYPLRGRRHRAFRAWRELVASKRKEAGKPASEALLAQAEAFSALSQGKGAPGGSERRS